MLEEVDIEIGGGSEEVSKKLPPYLITYKTKEEDRVMAFIVRTPEDVGCDRRYTQLTSIYIFGRQAVSHSQPTHECMLWHAILEPYRRSLRNSKLWRMERPPN